MNAQSLELQLEMLLNRSPNDVSQGIHDAGDMDAMAGIMGQPLSRGSSGAMRWAFALIMLGLGIIASVIFVLSTSGPAGVQPETWTHAIFALVAGEVLIVVAAMIKTISTVDRSQELIQKFLRAQSRRAAQTRPRTLDLMPAPALRTASVDIPPLKFGVENAGSPSSDATPRNVLRGQIGGRPFAVQPDGLIEVETLLGRRRFASMEAAQDFVGGEIVTHTEPSAMPQIAA